MFLICPVIVKKQFLALFSLKTDNFMLNLVSFGEITDSAKIISTSENVTNDFAISILGSTFLLQ